MAPYSNSYSMVPVPPPTSRSESFLRVRPVVSRGDRVPQLPPHAVTALREKNHLPRPPTVMNCGHALTATTSQAVTNRLADKRMAAAAAAPPDEAAPTEPHRYIPRPSLPRRRVGQLQVAGDGAAAALKGVPPCSSQVLPPAEPGSGRVARETNRAAYTWHAAERKLSQHPMLGGAALPAGPVYTPSSAPASRGRGADAEREDPDLPARLTRSPGRTRRAWGYRW